MWAFVSTTALRFQNVSTLTSNKKSSSFYKWERIFCNVTKRSNLEPQIENLVHFINMKEYFVMLQNDPTFSYHKLKS